MATKPDRLLVSFDKRPPTSKSNVRQSLKIREKTIITKLLQSVTEVYYKVRQVLRSATGDYDYKVCLVLQSVTEFILKYFRYITKCDSYYKVRSNKGRFFFGWLKCSFF